MESKKSRDWHPLEYAHVFLWLIKDMCWAMDWVLVGCFMVVPTILAAFIITWIQRSQTSTLVHNLAISIWISANSCWMIAEFFGWEEQLKPVILFGFGSGLTLLVAHYFRLLLSQWGKV